MCVGQELKNGETDQLPIQWKDPDDYHNNAIDAYRQPGTNGNREAFDTIAEGLKIFPYDIDLLADAIHWGPVGRKEDWLLPDLHSLFREPSSCDAAGPGHSDTEKLQLSSILTGISSNVRTKTKERDASLKRGLVFADDYLAILCTRMKYWNWRAYGFAIDYLVDKRAKILEDPKDVADTLDMASRIAVLFSTSEIDLDHSKSAEAKVAIAKGDIAEARRILADAIKPAVADGPKNRPMPSCCVRLIDLLMDEGDFEEAVRIADAGIRSTAQTQPGATLAYFVYCKAIAYEALYLDSNGEDPWTLSAVEDLYNSAFRLLENATYKRNVVLRAKRLDIKLKDPDDQNGIKQRVQQLEERIAELEQINNQFFRQLLRR